MPRYIDADELLEKLKKSAEFHAENSREEVLLFRDRQIIREQPTADVQPVIHARWCVLKDEYGDIVEAVCTNCEANGVHKWNYCPNCGAKMEVNKE
jgi:hypothetical protein